MRFVASLFVIASIGALASCGGKVLWVPDGGGGSDSTSATTGKSSASSSKAATTGTGASCEALKNAMDAAVEAARECNPAVSSIQCGGLIILEDACGCPTVVANEKTPDKAAAAKSAITAWKSAGCGPFDCDQDCFPVVGGFCSETKGGSGACIGFGPD